MQWLSPLAGMTVLDGTTGAAGHSLLILKSLGDSGRLIALDRDPMMVKLATEKLSESIGVNCEIRCLSYIDAESVLSELGISGVDRVLLDLGLSSDQLADRTRGFGFDAGGPLDMRFNPTSGRSAAQLLDTLTESELEHIFRSFGEEPMSAVIAAAICRRRRQGMPVITAVDLETTVFEALKTSRTAGGRNPATRVFQALRIAVNDELRHVERMMTEVLPRILCEDGIAVILTFHSLEDRIVKNALKGQQGWQVLTKTPVVATPAEIRLNPRSRSAKLRAAKWQGRS